MIDSDSKLENDFNGILFSKKIINDSDYKYLISQSSRLNLNLYLLDDWLEKNLNRIPNEYINFEKFIKKYNLIKQNTFHNRLKRFGDIFSQFLYFFKLTNFVNIWNINLVK